MIYRKIHQEEPKAQYPKKLSKNPKELPKNILTEKDYSLSKSSQLKKLNQEQEIQQLKDQINEMKEIAIDLANFKKRVEIENNLNKKEAFKFKQQLQIENNELKKNIQKLQKQNDEMKKKFKKENDEMKEKLKKVESKNLNLEIRIDNEVIANKSLIEEKKDIVNRLKETEKTLLNQNQKIEELSAKINIITYRDSIKEVLFGLLKISDSKLKNANYITYTELCNELAKFISSRNFKEKYFSDRCNIFTNFIKTIGNLIENFNTLVHEGEKGHNYSFEDFVNSFNIYARHYKLEEIDEYKKQVIYKNLDTFGLINCFM